MRFFCTAAAASCWKRGAIGGSSPPGTVSTGSTGLSGYTTVCRKKRKLRKIPKHIPLFLQICAGSLNRRFCVGEVRTINPSTDVFVHPGTITFLITGFHTFSPPLKINISQILNSQNKLDLNPTRKKIVFEFLTRGHQSHILKLILISRNRKIVSEFIFQMTYRLRPPLCRRL